jgi:hypothetical protein
MPLYISNCVLCFSNYVACVLAYGCVSCCPHFASPFFSPQFQDLKKAWEVARREVHESPEDAAWSDEDADFSDYVSGSDEDEDPLVAQ